MSTEGWTNLHDNDSFVDYRGAVVLPSRDGQSQLAGAGGIGPDGLNIPSKPVANQTLGPNTQAGRRWQENVFDIHRTGPNGKFPNGRPWNGPMELSANPDLKQPPGFVGALQQGMYVADDNDVVDRRATFASVWSAPWVPLEKYFVFNYKRKSLSFNYQRMLTEEQFGHDQYFEAAAKMAAGMHGVAVVYGAVPPYAITGVIGSPMPYIRNIKLAQAAMASDPWLLGFHPEPNAELAKLLGYHERTGLRMMSYTPEPAPIVQPEAVLATSSDRDLHAMIADAVAKALAEERAKNAAKGEQLRAGRAKKKQHKQHKQQKPQGTPTSATPDAA